MVLAQELINSDGISALGAAFFTGLFAMLTPILVLLVQNRKNTKKAAEASVKAAEKADEVVANTRPVSNGFAARMDKKLDLLATNQDRLESLFMEHLINHERNTK